MTRLNQLEVAAVRSIASNYPGFESGLVRILEACVVTKRENTGGGFFTTLASQTAEFSPIGLHSPLGDAWISIKGMRFGICCLVFLTEGYPTLLEGYAVGAEDTSRFDFGAVAFRVRSGPPAGEEDEYDSANQPGSTLPDGAADAQARTASTQSTKSPASPITALASDMPTTATAPTP